MVETIRTITTPLALAALALLLIAGLVRLSLGGGQSVPPGAMQLRKMVVHYSFLTALVLSVMANIVYMYVARAGSNILVSGTVMDDSGAFLGRAIVDIAGRARGVSMDDGRFEMVLSRAKSAAAYEATVSLSGYQTERIVLQGEEPQPFRVELKKPRLTAVGLISLGGPVLVGHYLGTMQVDVPLVLTNDTPADVHVDDLSVVVVTPDGQRVRVPIFGLYMAPGAPIMPALVSMDLKARESWRCSYMCMRDGADLRSLSQEAARAIPQQGIVPGKGVLPGELVTRLIAHMDKAFAWREGRWAVEITCKAGAVEYQRAFAWDLTPEQVERLREVRRYFAQGVGTVMGYHSWSSEDAAVPLQVTAKPQ